MKSKVLVAMSGGVDSSAVAALLQEEGHEVIGVTLQLHDAAGAAIRDAMAVAATLKIQHHVIDFRDRFEKSVISPFVETYLAGETPTPCVRCNKTIKFAGMMAIARDLGAEALATGHYVRRAKTAFGPVLRRPVDQKRDQSYFLFAADHDEISFLRFPLGDIPSKDETRAIAQKYGITIASKPDSQDICFLPDGNYVGLVSGRCGDKAATEGQIVNQEGRVLGHHQGIFRYTIGQRRGLGIGGTEEPLYVTALDAARKQVIVGGKDDLQVGRISLRDTVWLGEPSPKEGRDIMVRVRSTRGLKPARLFLKEKGVTTILLDQPEEGVAPGQACVFYQDDLVLGGGWIIREEGLDKSTETL